MSVLSIGDRVKIRGTRETYGLGVQHKIGTVTRVRGDGDLVDVDVGRERPLRLSAEEVTLATSVDLDIAERRSSRTLADVRARG